MENIGLTDSPATKDQFGIDTYIDGLSDFIVNCETPMTISIQGSWGSGKTSMMTMVQDKIKDKVIPVFFNTWQFSQFDMGNQLSISMINFFITKIATYNKKGVDKKEVLKKFATRSLGMLCNFARNYFGVGDVFPAKEDEKDKEHPDFAAIIDGLHADLEYAISEACTENKKDRVVVFIDDLDRLVPSKAMELLEVLKIFFDCKNCVFVLAIDYDVVIRGAAEKYGFNLHDHTPEGLKEAEKGKAFFDKIIQVPFKIPVVEYDINAYLKEGLNKINIKPTDEEMPYYQLLCAKSLGTNPRGLKRLLNAFLLLTKVRVIPDTKMAKSKQLLILFGLLCMQQYKEHIYNLIIRVNKKSSEDSNEALWLIAALCTGDEISKTINKKYNTDFYEDDIISFRPFFFDFLHIINLNPQSLHFMLDEELDDYSDEQQKVIDDCKECYSQLDDLLKLSATTANEDLSSISFSSMNVADMNESQKRKYNFFTRLKEDALNNKNFIESGLNFTKIQDTTFMSFSIGSSKAWLTIRFSIRKHKCIISYYFLKDFYSSFYPKHEELESALGFKLKWTDPTLDQKQFTANYDIENVDFEDEEKMKAVNAEIIEVMAKCKDCIKDYIR